MPWSVYATDKDPPQPRKCPSQTPPEHSSGGPRSCHANLSMEGPRNRPFLLKHATQTAKTAADQEKPHGGAHRGRTGNSRKSRSARSGGGTAKRNCSPQINDAMPPVSRVDSRRGGSAGQPDHHKPRLRRSIHCLSSRRIATQSRGYRRAVRLRRRRGYRQS